MGSKPLWKTEEANLGGREERLKQGSDAELWASLIIKAAS